MKKFISIILLFVFRNVSAQDYYFTNPNLSLININPSFAGSNEGLRIQSVTQNENPYRYRSATYFPPNLSNRFHAFNSADMYFKKLHGAVAFSCSNYFSNNKYERFTKQEFNLTYAQHFKIKNLKIIPSVQVSFIKNRQIYKDAFYNEYPFGWVDFGPFTPPPRDTKAQDFDVNSGLLFQYKKFYGGFSAFHLTQPNLGNRYPIPMLFNFHASYNIIVSEKVAFNFFTRFSAEEKPLPMYIHSTQIAVSAVLFKHFVIGVGGSTGINQSIESMFTSQLGYRTNCFSVILGYGGGGLNYSDVWELALSYNLRNKENRKKLTAFEAW